MTDTDSLTDQEVMAKTIWGEARNQGDDGLMAIASVIMNRVNSGIKWWGTDARSVCLHPSQFSCWLQSDPNRPKLMAVTEADAIYATALAFATNALSENLADNTNGADSYYALNMPQPPSWAEGLTPCAKIGTQLFFKTVHLYNPEDAFKET